MHSKRKFRMTKIPEAVRHAIFFWKTRRTYETNWGYQRRDYSCAEKRGGVRNSVVGETLRQCSVISDDPLWILIGHWPISAFKIQPKQREWWFN